MTKTIKATIGIAVGSNGEWYAHGQGPCCKGESENEAEYLAAEALSVFYESFEVPNTVQVDCYAHEIEIPVPHVGRKLYRLSCGKAAEVDALWELLHGLADTDAELFRLDEEIRQTEHRLGMLRRFREWSLREDEILERAMDATSSLPPPDASVSAITDTVTVQREVRVECDERPQVSFGRPPSAEPAAAVSAPAPPAQLPDTSTACTVAADQHDLHVPNGAGQPTPPAPPAEPAEQVRPLSMAEQRRLNGRKRRERMKEAEARKSPDQPYRTERKNADETHIQQAPPTGSTEDAVREQRRRDRERERSRRRREQAKSTKPKPVKDDCHLTTSETVEASPIEPEPPASEAEPPQNHAVAQETAQGTLNDDIRGHLAKYGGKPTVHDLARFWGVTAREITGAIGGMDDVEVCAAGYVRFKPGCEPAEAA